MDTEQHRMAFVAKNWRDLIRPRELAIVDHDARHARFGCEPLERGYGTTLGVMLRRTLLSALPGAAVTHVGWHAAPGDRAAIVFAIKELVVTSKHDAPVVLRLVKDTPGVVTAGDIALADGVSFCDREQPICTLAAGERIALELVIGVGRGYAPAERHAADRPDMLAIDALFAPVRKVDFQITNARVGHLTDYDRLVLDVWTSGALDPVDAVSQVAVLLRQQLDLFLNFEEVPEPVPVPRDETAERQNENLWRTVDELELSVRASNCLRNMKITYIGELVTRSEAELMHSRGFGRKSLGEITSVLAEMELHLGMKLPDWRKAKEASAE
jgi:DNA-directed RNA polymerase subunit alpha